jgi:CYTH domain-containing protein
MEFREKYAKIEWERRFLLARFPVPENVTRVRKIIDRYIIGTTLRLREEIERGGETRFKLTQKLPRAASGGQQGFISTMYLSEAEFEVFATLPSRLLTKARHSIHPFGVDVFEGELQGLVLAEAESDSAKEAAALILPTFLQHEVTDDTRFTGGRLVNASRHEVEKWVSRYGVSLNSN